VKELARRPGRRRASPPARAASRWGQGRCELLLPFHADGCRRPSSVDRSSSRHSKGNQLVPSDFAAATFVFPARKLILVVTRHWDGGWYLPAY
jgi:hypothetical protein